jgi:ubiquinone/menaquinone biosynthesis C-methylase UbiE
MEQEEMVSTAFSGQSSVFDTLTTTNPMEVIYRDIIREHVVQLIKQEQKMLELNCGTGLDATYFATKGLVVHAIDNSDGMLQEFNKKLEDSPLKERISFQKCSFNELNLGVNHMNFDHVFSNFGGLNCAEDLQAVIKQVNTYVKTGGMVHFVMINPVCLWELLVILKGKYKFALRRLTKKGVKSHLYGGHYFLTYYYPLSYIKKAFGQNYKIEKIRGVGCVIPPTYNNYFPEKYPKLFETLRSIESKVNTFWPFNRIGDLYIITLKKVK